MKTVYADLHIHIGRTSAGRPVKVTAARDLTFANIAKECAVRKGIEMAGIVDCGSPAVIREIEGLIASGEMQELPQGGLRYRGVTTVILGCELETVEEGGGLSHHISYFPTLSQLRAFVGFLTRLVSNPNLSSQSCHAPARKLLDLAKEAGGIFVPAHAFTPHKSPYGSCVARLTEMFGEAGLCELAALELGLSADSCLADRIAELAPITFLSNSDAHSLPRIAREYNVLRVEAASFQELVLALARTEGRGVVANYGLDPRLGKYHRTFCLSCETIAMADPPVSRCPACGSEKVVKGVLDRIVEIGEYGEPRSPAHRPPYHYQVPLQMLPGIGAVALGKLLNRFGTEMRVLHEAAPEELEVVVGKKLAELVAQARTGNLRLLAGGGGRYGKAVADPAETQTSLGV
jgi:uncharacterized protein (TIGR00375 family)